MELVFNGRVAGSRVFPSGSTSGEWRTRLVAQEDGWLAARASGNRRDSFYQPIFAHTSPVWLNAGCPPDARSLSAGLLVRAIDDAIQWVQTMGKYTSAKEREQIVDLYRNGQAVYSELV